MPSSSASSSSLLKLPNIWTIIEQMLVVFPISLGRVSYNFRQKDGFSFGELVYIRFLYDCSWRFFSSHSFEFKVFGDCRENLATLNEIDFDVVFGLEFFIR